MDARLLSFFVTAPPPNAALSKCSLVAAGWNFYTCPLCPQTTGSPERPGDDKPTPGCWPGERPSNGEAAVGSATIMIKGQPRPHPSGRGPTHLATLNVAASGPDTHIAGSQPLTQCAPPPICSFPEAHIISPRLSNIHHSQIYPATFFPPVKALLPEPGSLCDGKSHCPGHAACTRPTGQRASTGTLLSGLMTDGAYLRDVV